MKHACEGSVCVFLQHAPPPREKKGTNKRNKSAPANAACTPSPKHPTTALTLYMIIQQCRTRKGVVHILLLRLLMHPRHQHHPALHGCRQRGGGKPAVSVLLPHPSKAPAPPSCYMVGRRAGQRHLSAKLFKAPSCSSLLSKCLPRPPRWQQQQADRQLHCMLPLQPTLLPPPPPPLLPLRTFRGAGATAALVCGQALKLAALQPVLQLHGLPEAAALQ